MPTPPRFLCPRCGRNLSGCQGTLCPECGFVLTPSRASHRGNVRYWHFLRARQRVAFALAIVWSAGIVAAYKIISISPTPSLIAITVAAAVAMLALSRYLVFRRPGKP